MTSSLYAAVAIVLCVGTCSDVSHGQLVVRPHSFMSLGLDSSLLNPPGMTLRLRYSLLHPFG